jgi:hypothetical protein
MQRSSVDLHRVPPRQRRQLGVLLSPVAAVLLVAGVLLGWLAGSPAGHLIGVLVALLALALLGVGYGLLRSAGADERERLLDEAIRQATGPCGAECGSAGCGSTDCGSTDCAMRTLPRR